jgi:hypothetical protein
MIAHLCHALQIDDPAPGNASTVKGYGIARAGVIRLSASIFEH